MPLLWVCGGGLPPQSAEPTRHWKSHALNWIRRFALAAKVNTRLYLIRKMETPAFLRIIAGPADSQSLPLETLHTKTRLTFGRHRSCDFVLSHPTVSRQHFFLEMTGGKLLIVDNSSGNGTFVNGDRISWAELKVGDRIQAGPFVLIAEISPEAVGSAEAAVDSLDPAATANTESMEAISPLHSRFHGIYPREYLQGVDHFNAGRYFEA